MAVNGDVSERPSPAKVRGVFLASPGDQGASGLAQVANAGVIYVLESVLRVVRRQIQQIVSISC